jgi:hypothetical protein
MNNQTFFRRNLTAAVAALCMSLPVWSQQPKIVAPKTTGEILQRSLSITEKVFLDAAEAMPAEKFDFVPTAGEFKGVRSFGQLVMHTAATNMFFAYTILEEKPPLTMEETTNGPEKIKGKAAIMKYARDSFAAAHRALDTITSDNPAEQIPFPFSPSGKSTRMGLSLVFIGHTNEEYGQMVEYLRMNGIVPPASRPNRAD